MNKLEEIIRHKRNETAERTVSVPVHSLQAKPLYKRKSIPFMERIRNSVNGFGIIAEFKRRSPSAGTINESIDPADAARAYAQHGAAAISVLTDEKYFGGSLSDLERVRDAVELPLLRKDFIIAEYQIHEAKAFGADAVLLIADVLSRRELNRLYESASAVGLECLVELYDRLHIAKLDFNRMKLIGINNRDLRTFTVDINRTKEIIPYLPDGVLVISESGIQSSEDIDNVKRFGAHGALIGEHFMKHGYDETFH